MLGSCRQIPVMTMARQLIEAIRNGDQSLAKSLLKSERYGCIDCQTAKRDGTALFWACAKGFVELVHLLIAKGANVNARTNYNSTPLIAAADSNRHHVVRLLIEQGADVNAQTSNGDTACHQAAYRGHVEAVQLLVAHGADVDIANTKFRTPYDEAARQGHHSLLPFLDGTEKVGPRRGDLSITTSCNKRTRTANGRTAGCGLTRTGPCDHPRRDSCDCLSHESLSRESSYEDCGQAAVLMNPYDFSDRLRDRELDFAVVEPERFFPSGHPSYPPSAVSYPSSTALSFSKGDEFSFTSSGDVSFTRSSLPYSYRDANTNDLSLASDRSSGKNVVARLNIPA